MAAGAELVSGVVLAAGPSTRFGEHPPKQLLVLDGEPLIRRTLRRALDSRLAEVVVVIGFARDAMSAAIADLPVRVVENPHFATGQSSSVKAGLAAVDRTAAAAMFLPVDQPALSVTLIDALIARYVSTGGPIVVPVYRGRRAAPVIFDRGLFDALRALEGDAGGRQLFPSHERQIVELPVADPESLLDIDTPEDLRRFRL